MQQKCPYCFATEKLVPAGSPRSCFITLKDLQKAIDFLKRSKEVRVNIMGVEPTLHPEFQKSISMVIQSGLNIILFSNGLMSKDDALFLKAIESEKCLVVLNINAPEICTGTEWAAVNRTMKAFKNTVSITLSALGSPPR